MSIRDCEKEDLSANLMGGNMYTHTHHHHTHHTHHTSSTCFFFVSLDTLHQHTHIIPLLQKLFKEERKR